MISEYTTVTTLSPEVAANKETLMTWRGPSLPALALVLCLTTAGAQELDRTA